MRLRCVPELGEKQQTEGEMVDGPKAKYEDGAGM